MNKLNQTLGNLADNIEACATLLYKLRNYKTYEECLAHANKFYIKLVNGELKNNNSNLLISSFNIKR